MKRWLIPLVLILLAACGQIATPAREADPARAGQQPTEAPPATAPSVNFIPLDQKPGEKNYNVYCAHCHGYDGEGQLADTLERTRALGYHTVPPHDSTGHTWMHTDELLLQVIREGIQNPLDLYVMAGYSSVLSDQEIMEIIDYIKGWWTEEQREYQRQITEHARQTRQELGLEDGTSTPEPEA